MKILEVTNLFSPVHGGSAEVPSHLSRELAKRGHEVTVYTSDFKLSREYLKSLPDVKVYPFRTWLGLAQFYITPTIINTAKEEMGHYDIIHLHNFRTFQNIVVHHYAQQHGIPYIIQAHGSLTTFFQKGTLKKVFDSLWGHSLLRDTTRVIAVTKIEAEQYKSMGVKEYKIEIIPHGVDLYEFANLPPRGEFRRKYNLSNSERIVLYLGRIHKIKGLDLLTKAFAHLSQALSDTRLVIVGPDDGYLAPLKNLVSDLKIGDRVLFTGPLYGEEKLKAYVDAQVYVLPSSYEIFGITILEACACGTPVVITDRCGLADAIDGQAGLIVPCDEEQLQQALTWILSDDQIRLKLGNRGKALVREQFDWTKIAAQIERLYQNIITSN